MHKASRGDIQLTPWANDRLKKPEGGSTSPQGGSPSPQFPARDSILFSHGTREVLQADGTALQSAVRQLLLLRPKDLDAPGAPSGVVASGCRATGNGSEGGGSSLSATGPDVSQRTSGENSKKCP